MLHTDVKDSIGLVLECDGLAERALKLTVGGGEMGGSRHGAVE